MTPFAQDSAPVHAKWRGLTGPCQVCGASVLSFDLPDGGALRLELSSETMRDLAEVCGGARGANAFGRFHAMGGDQASRLSGSSQAEGSIPEYGQTTCPLHRSSNAASGE